MGLDELKGVLPKIFAMLPTVFPRVLSSHMTAFQRSSSTELVPYDADEKLPAVIPNPHDQARIEEEYFDAKRGMHGC